jgi:hypothetical protein
MKLVRVYWTDAHNTSGGWHDRDELLEFVEDNNWRCSNVGWLAYEDDECVAIAARVTHSKDQFGLIERIPRKMIEKIEELKAVKEAYD